MALLFLLGTHCLARLGDSPTECAARYGQPISHGSGKDKGNETGLDWYAYASGGYEREVHFNHGRSVFEIIWKIQQPDRPSARPPLSEKVQQLFLDENAIGMTWSKPVPSYKSLIWTRTDKATAMYSNITNEMEFSSFRWQ
ncbi:MAG: hypothetical protein LV481_10355 [Methylacidiphilales bacterium]|nr:hypothetical protein [Candidatus Methylacidiphilales bacterium]